MAAVPDKHQSPRIQNRKAFHDYHILEKLETGIVLQGSEVKSIRSGSVSLASAFAMIDPRSGELFLHDADIAPYDKAHGSSAHEPKRPRKLLAHKREIAKLADKTITKGVTLVPLAMYFVRGRVKVELGIAQGKKDYDKRQDLKKREARRDIERGMTRKVI